MGEIEKHPHRPTDEVLETVMLEAEAIVNSRPLTYIPLDNEGTDALTPNHFLLYGNQGIVQPRSATRLEGATLRDSWKLTQYLVDQFWKRWVREYLPTLTRRTKWFQPTKPLEVGDVVLVVDENKRNGWKRGRIIEVHRGKDEQVRRAVVQTNDGVLKRPATKLAVLDVQQDRKTDPEAHGRGNVANRCNQAERNVCSRRSPTHAELSPEKRVHGSAA
ncbi:uncharacterized protein LOC119766061 [Culex quinquefasciatus]|uniref:uncharacterized protein LOC119766061 n=1 Tax=Culex quinquefasciatus TaxID=7176 RepID=UPI0018E2E857|nr:uncharacterized protein LOC119766061 [Culex quinquefasciatus]